MLFICLLSVPVANAVVVANTLIETEEVCNETAEVEVVFWYSAEIIKNGDKAFIAKNTKGNNGIAKTGGSVPSDKGAFIQYNTGSHTFTLWVNGDETRFSVSVSDAYSKEETEDGWTKYSDENKCLEVWATAWAWKWQKAYFQSKGCSGFTIPTAG